MTNPFTELAEHLQRIERKIDALTTTPAPAKVEQPDRMSFSEALIFLNQNGISIGKSRLYQLTCANEIPHGTFNGKRGRLVFSRKELSVWLDENIRKNDTEKQVADQLAKTARRKK